ncbi:MAG: 3-dehydroquinate synthase [Candidatus Marinimicrobia bacterium]|jgi:3-dehydroquinate synthase|nr:3-dehydroquinate synthase [Candidatus Neomarinimicrobiota bacterium]MDP6611533.1 3-dehydroquinate synthase [Candidatus Neomarinimicrobiota bacterium]|tara:strand:+ start:878 stop:1948 length:1071 start_codon:yes stop_codon:yes gene_type:complete
MKSIQVNLGNRSYPIHVQSGLMQQSASILSDYNHGQKWVIISQFNLMELFGFDLLNLLKEADFDADFVTLPVGESAKNITEFSRVVGQMVELNCDRSATIIALGGGVVGDVAGFVASSFMRGIEYYQIPTTLLAMVDSSIGGKTGINIVEGKNLVGAIYQPQGVLIDPDILDSLPREEVIAGLGEVIKYGAIWDRNFLNEIASWVENLDTFPYEDAITKSCEIKAEVVSKDEREGDLRRILNFGHTIGHALESHLGYGRIRHGEAVALGMKCAGFISQKLGLLSKEEQSTLVETINRLPLPELRHINGNHLMPFIKTDKKSEKGGLNFVVLDGLGNATTTTDVTEDLIQESLKVLN